MAEIYAPRAARANEIGALSHNAAPAPFHAVASAAMPYVKIAPDRAQVSSEGELTYAIPAALRGKLEIGAAVLAPFGRQFVTGYVTGFTDSLDFDASRLKPISRLLKASLFDENALQVARWMSAYYHCALGECLACYVPSGARQDSEKRYAFAAQSFDEAARVLARSPRQKQIAQILFDAPKTLSQKEIEKSCGGDALPALRQLVTAQIVEETDELQNAAVKPRLGVGGATHAGSDLRRRAARENGCRRAAAGARARTFVGALLSKRCEYSHGIAGGKSGARQHGKRSNEEWKRSGFFQQCGKRRWNGIAR